MENVHLAVEEDDIYSGYNDYNPTFDNEVRAVTSPATASGLACRLVGCTIEVPKMSIQVNNDDFTHSRSWIRMRASKKRLEPVMEGDPR